MSQENRERIEAQAAAEERERQQLALMHRRQAVEAQIESLRAELKLEEKEFARVAASGQQREKQIETDRQVMSANRRVAGGNKQKK